MGRIILIEQLANCIVDQESR